jgi:NADPH:quinone reductase-like Zn-dependent oxidoreductase
LLAVADGADDSVKAEAKGRGVRVEEPLVEPDGHGLQEIAKLVHAGVLKVTVNETFPLERAAAAHERQERGGVQGKLVLEVGHG